MIGISGEPILILTLHGLGIPRRSLARGEEDYWLSGENFSDLLDAIGGRSNVEITFDDGNASDVEVALPELRARGLKATFFVLVGLLDQPGYLSWGQLRELKAAGMTVGSHGMQHRAWPGLDHGVIYEEITGSRAILEKGLGESIVTAACPFGAYNRRVLHYLRQAGYRRVCTSDGGLARQGAWLCPRVTVRRDSDPTTIERALRGASPLARLKRSVKLAYKRWR